MTISQCQTSLLNIIHDLLLQETQLHIQCTQGDGQLIYAELAPPVVNPVSQPSSVENTAYAIINHTNQTD